ncbi:MAG: 23S rRNA (adenine(2030)-N(6))-methyltransferase RlmJ [Immundisolibacter sp.]|uniref:23S rRNA (adenine(2030)-N(6))-methyltransferase RlmJ n=1 Tax=Immundisolibacter sp. TaxID=1934948 RepID=UPI003D0F9366
MNYRHAFHAGNFADVVKHVCLVALLRGLTRKDSAWFYLDTHAGAGDYDLTATPAQKTGEYRDGIARLLSAPGPLPAALADYLGVIRPLLGDGDSPRRYPGSPLIAAALGRPQDRLVACELNPLEFEALQAACGGAVHVQRTDGYQALKALLPPRERRGLTLIDPPYERPDEFTRLAGELVAAHRRFATGVYALWYPLKDEAPVAGLKRALKAAGLRRLLVTELRLTPLPTGGMLHGCGVLVLNPPWGFAEQMKAALPALARILSPDTGTATVDWLVPE